MRAEIRHLECWALKEWKEAIFAGELKVSLPLSSPAPPAFGLATQVENLICSTVNIVCREIITVEVKLGGAYYQCRTVL